MRCLLKACILSKEHSVIGLDVQREYDAMDDLDGASAPTDLNLTKNNLRNAMKSIGIQFHATSEEIAQIITNAIDKFSLFFEGVIINPFSIKKIILKDMINIFHEIEPELHLKIYLSLNPINTNCKDESEFIKNNFSLISFEIGRQLNGFLEESFFSTIPKDEHTLRTAELIAKDIKKKTKAGVTAINPNTGAKAYIRTNRYTQGAVDLAKQGVKMIAWVGNSFFEFEK